MLSCYYACSLPYLERLVSLHITNTVCPTTWRRVLGDQWHHSTLTTSNVTSRHWGPKQQASGWLQSAVSTTHVACSSDVGHHPNPLGYHCAKFRFCRGLSCWASPRRKIAYSVSYSLIQLQWYAGNRSGNTPYFYLVTLMHEGRVSGTAVRSWSLGFVFLDLVQFPHALKYYSTCKCYTNNNICRTQRQVLAFQSRSSDVYPRPSNQYCECKAVFTPPDQIQLNWRRAL